MAEHSTWRQRWRFRIPFLVAPSTRLPPPPAPSSEATKVSLPSSSMVPSMTSVDTQSTTQDDAPNKLLLPIFSLRPSFQEPSLPEESSDNVLKKKAKEKKGTIEQRTQKETINSAGGDILGVARRASKEETPAVRIKRESESSVAAPEARPEVMLPKPHLPKTQEPAKELDRGGELKTSNRHGSVGTPEREMGHSTIEGGQKETSLEKAAIEQADNQEAKKHVSDDGMEDKHACNEGKALEIPELTQSAGGKPLRPSVEPPREGEVDHSTKRGPEEVSDEKSVTEKGHGQGAKLAIDNVIEHLTQMRGGPLRRSPLKEDAEETKGGAPTTIKLPSPLEKDADETKKGTPTLPNPPYGLEKDDKEIENGASTKVNVPTVPKKDHEETMHGGATLLELPSMLERQAKKIESRRPTAISLPSGDGKGVQHANRERPIMGSLHFGPGKDVGEAEKEESTALSLPSRLKKDIKETKNGRPVTKLSTGTSNTSSNHNEWREGEGPPIKENEVNEFDGKQEEQVKHLQHNDLIGERKGRAQRQGESFEELEKLGSWHPMYITFLAGCTKGASMFVGTGIEQFNDLGPIKKAYSPMHRDGQIDTGQRKKDEEFLARNQPTKSTINSNSQSVNNSILSNSSCNVRAPGVHIYFTVNPSKPFGLKCEEGDNPTSTSKESNVMDAQRLVHHSLKGETLQAFMQNPAMSITDECKKTKYMDISIS